MLNVQIEVTKLLNMIVTPENRKVELNFEMISPYERE